MKTRTSLRALVLTLAGLCAGLTFLLAHALPTGAAGAPLPVGWSQGPAPSAGFVPQWDMSVSYYPPMDQVVVFGGSPKKVGETWSNQTWIYSNGTWTKGPAAPAGMLPRGGAAMAYHPGLGKLVLFGGAGDRWPPLADTWLWDGARWTRGPDAPPSMGGRSGAQMAYLPPVGQLVLFSGSGVAPYKDTWMFDGTAWTAGPATPSAVSPRVFYGMTYDPERQALLIAGGNGGTDAWYFNGASWSAAPSLDPVGPKERFRMAYDPQLQAVVLFGGYGPGGPSDQAWMLKAGTWSKIVDEEANQGWPVDRADAAVVWHPTHDAMMVIGGIADGYDGEVGLADVWFFRDTPPQVASVSISPSAPTLSTPLTLSIGATTGGYGNTNRQIEWYVNGALLPGQTDVRLELGNFGTGDRVHARVRATDQLDLTGPWVTSATVEVGNRAPSIGSVGITPSKAYLTSTLSAVAYNVIDPDADTVTLHYRWSVDGSTVPGNDAPTLAPTHFQGGSSVVVTATAVDEGGAESSPVSSVAKPIEWNLNPPASVTPGKTVGVSGGGYAPGEKVNVKLDSSSSATIASINATSEGKFSGLQLPVPSPYHGGNHMLYGVGQTSGTVGQGVLVVIPKATVSPGSVGAGEPATVSGVGFVPSESVSVSFSGGNPVSKTADATGSVTASLTAPEAPAGTGLVSAAAPSGTASTTYTVLGRLVTPAQAQPQDAVTVKVTGFGAGERVDVTFNTSTSVVMSFTTDPKGTGQATVTLDLLYGKHTIKVKGATTAITKSNTINLPATMSLTPTSGVVGTLTDVRSGPGWAPGGNVQLIWQASTVLKTVQADSTGRVVTSFAIPVRAPGLVWVKLKGTSPALTAQVQFQIVGSSSRHLSWAHRRA
jgi:hypothetical protein